MSDTLFESIADAIFKEAGVSRNSNEDLWNETVQILNTKMAMLSPMGLTWSRVEAFEQQKKSLIKDSMNLK